MIDFNTAYRVRMPAVARCRISLGSEKMEEVSLNIWEQSYVSYGRWVAPIIHHQMSVAFFKGQTRGDYLKWLIVYL